MDQIKKTVLTYFQQNPFIHLGIQQLVEVLQYEAKEELNATDIKIAALSLVEEGRIQMDKKWRMHL